MAGTTVRGQIPNVVVRMALVCIGRDVGALSHRLAPILQKS